MSHDHAVPTQNFAHVLRIKAIEPHPDPEVTRLEVITLTNDVRLVTGKHYRVGLLGIHLKPGCLIPGWLAEQLWLVGKKRATAWFQVREIEIKGVASPGLFCGAEYVTDGSAESIQRADEMYAAGAQPVGDGWIAWPYWRDHWAEGHTLDGYLGVIPVPEPIVAKPFGEASHRLLGELPVASGAQMTWHTATIGHGSVDATSGHVPTILPIVPRD